MTHWNLDAASVLAANLLKAQLGETVLDLCAAPGGKSIVLAQNIWPSLRSKPSDGFASLPQNRSHLTSNELDGLRYKRLAENLKAYLPTELFHSRRITTHRIDGTDPLAHRKLSIGGIGYDKVLVDAPCSSERHIIHAHLAAQAGGRIAPEMANWRPGSSKQLAKTQVDLLMTGLRAAKTGGSILYATCSIEPAENDGVIEKVLATVNKELKKGAKISIRIGFKDGVGDLEIERTLELDWAERTKHGWISCRIIRAAASGVHYSLLC
jgi:16S rRNA C967 or C1407 C5-methylase (RsmB/RsmF family)